MWKVSSSSRILYAKIDSLYLLEQNTHCLQDYNMALFLNNLILTYLSTRSLLEGTFRHLL